MKKKSKLLEEELKILPKMPYFLDKNQKQSKTEQANQSRMCIKIRWVKEATNSFLKHKFRALDAIVQNKSFPHYLIDFRFAGDLIL